MRVSVKKASSPSVKIAPTASVKKAPSPSVTKAHEWKTSYARLDLTEGI